MTADRARDALAAPIRKPPRPTLRVVPTAVSALRPWWWLLVTRGPRLRRHR